LTVVNWNDAFPGKACTRRSGPILWKKTDHEGTRLAGRCRIGRGPDRARLHNFREHADQDRRAKAVEHLAAYLLCGFILVRALGSYRRAPIVFAFLVALAGAIEIVQLWVPGRTFDVWDWGAGSLGVMIGVLLAVRETEDREH
jgi:VanZ like family